MKIILAKTAGYCMGVRRAVEIAENAATENKGTVYTHGPLIHNRQAVEELEEQGVHAVNSTEGIKKGRMIIRAHGIPKDEKLGLEEDGFECIDATCPHVLSSQKRIEKESSLGKIGVLVGDRDHAEMIGLAGYCSTNYHIISTEKEAEKLIIDKPFFVIAQTTFNAVQYEKICAILKAKNTDCTIYKSICEATADRQKEVQELSRECDAIVVVGGLHSANTKRLAEIGEKSGKPTFHIEIADELDLEKIKKYNTIGITAGASTPESIIKNVIKRLEKI
jgi:4-hydroxy-3-methylbut-2-enyl diphosphate reductase